MSTQQTFDVTALERLILNIRGIQASRVMLDPQGRIDEVHAISSPGRSAKQIVRDIESILLLRAGIRLDHRKVSLVQLPENLIQVGGRIRLLEVSADLEGETPGVTVSLGVGDQCVQGFGSKRADRPSTPTLLAAYATIHALNTVIGPNSQIHFESLHRQPLGELDIVLCHVKLAYNGFIDSLVGTSVVRDDELSAVARAVLDAVNRRLKRILDDPY